MSLQISLKKKIVYGLALGLILVTGTSFAQSGNEETISHKALKAAVSPHPPIRSVGQETAVAVTWSCQVECEAEKKSNISLGQVQAPTRIQNAAGTNTRTVNAGNASVVAAGKTCISGGKSTLREAYEGLQNLVGSMTPGCNPCKVSKEQLVTFKEVGQTCKNSKSGVAMKVSDVRVNLTSGGGSTTTVPAAQ